MPPKKKMVVRALDKRGGRPRDVHQTKEKEAWRVRSAIRYAKNPAAWHAYITKYRRASQRPSPKLPARTWQRRNASQLKRNVSFVALSRFVRRISRVFRKLVCSFFSFVCSTFFLIFVPSFLYSSFHFELLFFILSIVCFYQYTFWIRAT